MPALKALERAAYDAADELKQLIAVRTGLKGSDLQCPRERSEMTPCIARDGRLAVCFNTHEHAMCVGCESGVEFQLNKERAKHG